jgi:hypothetical protein
MAQGMPNMGQALMSGPGGMGGMEFAGMNGAQHEAMQPDYYQQGMGGGMMSGMMQPMMNNEGGFAADESTFYPNDSGGFAADESTFYPNDSNRNW